MEFDTSDLRAGKLTFHPDIVDMVVFDQTESGSHTSADTGLLAMGYFIIANDMRTDILLVPSVPDCIESDFDIMQGTVEACIVQPDVMSGLTFFSQSDTRTFGVADDIVFDNPSFIPMGRYHTDLFGSRAPHWVAAWLI